MKSRLILLFPLALFAGTAAASPRLGLNEYIDQVNGKSPALESAKLQADGGMRRAEGASVLTFPYLFGGFNSGVDKAETLFPTQQGTQTDSTIYSVGLGMNTAIGLNGKYTWNNSDINTVGIPFATAGRYTAYNRLDLTLNLGRNGFGSEIRARKELIRAGSTSQALAGQFTYVAKIAEAESTYWRLATARQAVLVQKDVLARAQKLLDWAKRRVNLQLGDKSDLLQAQATNELHVLELATAAEEEKSSARAFNLLRNQPGDSVPEAVALPSIDDTLKMAAPARAGERLDLQATAERTKALQAQSQLDKESLKPNVDLTGIYAWNGRDPQRSEAISEGFKNSHPTRAIGLTFSVPLNVPTWIRGIRGVDMQIEAADLDLAQSRLVDARDWSDLSAKFNDARSRLALIKTIEGIQKEKFENERQRLLRGRTTTYQALTFEQDYAQSQLLRIRTQAEVLNLLATMKTYRGNQ